MRVAAFVSFSLVCIGHCAKQHAPDWEALNPTAAFSSAGPASSLSHRRSSSADRAGTRMETIEDLKTLARRINPLISYWDPLKLAEKSFWNQGDEATIGFLRESELKHGRIAMFGFVGFCVHHNDIRWPWAPFNEVTPGPSPQMLWEELPPVAKAQIFLFIGFLEFWRESTYVLEKEGQKHYMRGGTPGYFPTFDQLPHPVPFNLYDPFGLSKNMNPDKKARRLAVELNNGRAAMIGLMSLLVECQTPGAIPPLEVFPIRTFRGNIMAPFEGEFSFLDFFSPDSV